MKPVSPGEVFCCMDHPVQVNLSWQRPVLLSAKVLSSRLVVQILYLSGWESQSVLSSSFSRWLEKGSPPLFSSMRWTLFADPDPRVKMIHLAELRLSFWFKCKVSVMTWTVFLCLVRLMCHGSSITLSDVDSKSVFTFSCLMQMLELEFSRTRLAKQKMIVRKQTLFN